MPQKHDQKFKKRQANSKQAECAPGPEFHARELVRRGLASPQILSPRKATNNE